MTAILVRVAEAIKKELESIVLSQKFSLSRTYGDFEDLLADNESGVRIDVVPNSCLSSLMDRGGRHLYECNVSVLLRKRLLTQDYKSGRIDNSVLDQLVEDLQTVHQFFAPRAPNFQGRKLADVPEASWSTESKIKAPFSRKLLKAPGQYSGWCAVVYDATVAPTS